MRPDETDKVKGEADMRPDETDRVKGETDRCPGETDMVKDERDKLLGGTDMVLDKTLGICEHGAGDSSEKKTKARTVEETIPYKR